MNIQKLPENYVFVFGSNLAGRHGAGAAKWANQVCMAEYGIGEGPTGNSYALPTMDWNIRPLTLQRILTAVRLFRGFAASRPDLVFQVTQVGCGLGGRTKKDIAPMFAQMDMTKNCWFDTQWYEYMGDEYTYWGSV